LWWFAVSVSPFFRFPVGGSPEGRTPTDAEALNAPRRPLAPFFRYPFSVAVHRLIRLISESFRR
jgi:hypothetical protein